MTTSSSNAIITQDTMFSNSTKLLQILGSKRIIIAPHFYWFTKYHAHVVWGGAIGHLQPLEIISC